MDFLSVLRNPLQVKILKDHTKLNQSSYPIAEDTLVLSCEYLRANTTHESFATAAGGDPGGSSRPSQKPTPPSVKRNPNTRSGQPKSETVFGAR